jgi:NADH dehydrogenase [ubiquinone] 1 alpha subcomplex assembly factor 5
MQTDTPPLIFDRALLTLRRDRAARAWTTASSADFLLTRASEDLLDRLSAIKRAFPLVINIGAHHGGLSGSLRASGRHDTVIDLDSARGPLAHCKGLKAQADEEALPLKSGAVDAVLSALALQHVNDLPGTLTQIRQALKPDGLLLAALIGGETLTELRQAFVAAEAEMDGGASPRVAPFADGRDLGSLLQRAGFALPVVDSDRFSVAYATPLALLADLRAMGATNVMIERRRTPLRRATLLRACEIYAERFARADGKVLATFEILTLTAWAPHESQQKPLRPGSASARLADALGTREQPSGDKPGRG